MYKTLVLGLVFLVLFSCVVSAETVYPTLDLQINKDNFVPGEYINVTAFVYNRFDYILSAKLNGVLGSSDPNFQPRLPEEDINILLQPSERKEVNLFHLKVEDDFSEGEYEVTGILETGTQTLSDINLKFSVSGTLKDFTLDLNSCRDQTCSDKSKMFKTGEKIYLSYTSDISPTITSKLTSPDNSVQNMDLPTSITPNQIGSYKLEVTAKKQGYKTVTKKLEFAVIQKDVDIKTKPTVTPLTPGTTTQLSGEPEKTNWDYIIIGVVLIIIVVMVVAYLKVYKK